MFEYIVNKAVYYLNWKNWNLQIDKRKIQEIVAFQISFPHITDGYINDKPTTL